MQHHFIKSNTEPEDESVNSDKYIHKNNSSQGRTYNQATDDWDSHYNMIDSILEQEKQHNKTETWNKLDKMHKIQKLHEFAEKYGKTNNLSTKDIKSLKKFFIECIEKSKLQKTKDVEYDKVNHEIKSIPALHYNVSTHSYTLRILDNKRVSTLKSLTPKKAVPIKVEGDVDTLSVINEDGI
jgi:hypothetical protein